MSTDTERFLMARLEQIDQKLDRIIERGCSRVNEHALFREQTTLLFDKVNGLEKAAAEGKGRLAVIMGLISTVVGIGCAYIGKRM